VKEFIEICKLMDGGGAKNQSKRMAVEEGCWKPVGHNPLKMHWT